LQLEKNLSEIGAWLWQSDKLSRRCWFWRKFFESGLGGQNSLRSFADYALEIWQLVRQPLMAARRFVPFWLFASST
jgi:hypothetical protein